MPGQKIVVGTPGTQAKRTAVSRKILKDPLSAQFLPHGVFIDGSKSRDVTQGVGDEDVLRAGQTIGKITATDKFAVSILGVINNAESASSVALEVSVQLAVEIVRRIGTSGTFILKGPPSAAGTVAQEVVTYTGIDTGTGVITVDAISNAYIAGSQILPEDGSENILGLLNTEFGLDVTDIDNIDREVDVDEVLIGGVIFFDRIINAPTDSSLVSDLKAQLRANGTGFAFDDDF